VQGRKKKKKKNLFCCSENEAKVENVSSCFEEKKSFPVDG